MTRGPQYRAPLPAELDHDPRRTDLPPGIEAELSRSGAVTRLVCLPLMMALGWWAILETSWSSTAAAWIVYVIMGLVTLIALGQALAAAGDLLSHSATGTPRGPHEPQQNEIRRTSGA